MIKVESHMETSTEAWLARDAAALAPTLSRVNDVVAASGEGSWIVDVDGRRYLDLGSGIAVTSIGHCHPALVAAVEAQVRTLVHTSVTAHHTPAVLLAERLGSACPFFAAPQVFFCNSGAEAVDGAIKLARRTTGRPGIVAFSGGFHGRTLGATSLTTAKVHYRKGYDPLLPSVHIAPYANPTATAYDAEAAAVRALDGLDDLFAHVADPSTVAAMIVEPVLGEGGYVVPPRSWLAGLRERADRHGVLLVFDEVQTGGGRTGAYFAAEAFDVRPDVVLFAKGVAGGMPLGGLIAETATFAKWPPGAHGTTFGGNPVSCAAALAVFDVVERDRLAARAATLGASVLRRLERELSGSTVVRNVRGTGLMIGVELADGDVARRVREACLGEGVLILTCGPDDRVIRLAPALTISDAELDLGVEALLGAIAAA